jgi:ATP-dependent Lhr-like helicase
VEVETAQASPVASSLMFEYIAQFMYDGDAPLAERRAQALSLDRDLLADLLGSDDLRELLDPAALATTELELQRLDERAAPRDADAALDVLRAVGDLADEEAAARGISAEWIEALLLARRAVRARVASQSRVIAADDAGRYRDALGVELPPGLVDSALAGGEDSLDALIRRYARSHVPFLAADVAARWGLPLHEVEARLGALARDGVVIAGHFRPGGAAREYCHTDVLQVLRRRSMAALRREVEAVVPDTLGRFLPVWHGVGSAMRGPERLLDIVAQLQGLPLSLRVLERDVLPARMAYDGPMLDELIAAGEVVWQGRGAIGRDDGRIALYRRGEAAALLAPAGDGPDSPVHAAIRDHLAQRGAAFARDLAESCPGVSFDEVVDALYDLVWAGAVTNDTLQPLRFLGPARRHPGRPLMRLVPPRAQGRWSLLTRAGHSRAAGTERGIAQAQILLQRYGVVVREAVSSEGAAGGFTGVYPVLRAMEEAGRIRRGYFVEGCGGAQFALPGAVDALRSQRGPSDVVVSLAATDPANPYGSILPWPELAGRAARAAGAHVVLRGGLLRLYIERGARSVLTAGPVLSLDVAALAALAARAGRMEVLTVDGAPVAASSIAPLLRDAGFAVSPRGLVLYGDRRDRPAAAAHARR